MIEIFDSTDKYPLQKIGKYAGVCWNSPIDDAEKNIKRAKDCIISGHGRVLEYVDIEMCITGYSARAIREYYTHIGGAPTRLQESTRYVNCDNFQYYIPQTTKTPEAEKIYKETMEFIRKKYGELLEAGVSKEDAANVLPLGMMTKIVDKRNLRNMINLMNQRLCTRAYLEIRTMANEIKKALSEYSDEWKWICDTLFVPKCDVSGFCTEKKCCGRRPKKD
ncbi:FAD-dependent thymidylate synthase [Treponema zioleckii]|uniref:FAD-dependent thymidylate synthase n=1 Tax=Treponema zioleckii TaxID=331680 RepID=UPI00168B0F10|nr:FAD-dependent thymidylate synthase [Treponema zioleckii]